MKPLHDPSAEKEDTPFYLNRLRLEFLSRRTRNSRYTMSAFSKHLDLKPATLSRILDRKRVPSLETVETIVNRLGLKPSDRRAFVRSTVESHLRSASFLKAEIASGYHDYAPSLITEMRKTLASLHPKEI